MIKCKFRRKWSVCKRGKKKVEDTKFSPPPYEVTGNKRTRRRIADRAKQSYVKRMRLYSAWVLAQRRIANEQEA